VQRPHKEFHVRELEIAIHGSNPEAEHNGPERLFLENDNSKDGYNLKDHASPKSLEANTIADPKTLKKLKQRLQDIETDIKEAESLHHTQKAEQLKGEYDDIIKYLRECFYSKDGKTMHFRDESTKQKDRICKSIQRAINLIAKYDRAAANHFQRALSPVKSFRLAYTPDREIDWSTD
jgi:hypothetical protein